ncbi:MAG: hypothetical protein KJ072_10165 [Verrucomicrobia bacterium]|nr:hypothetical protein [Verrucomicrobiota bacterium]
MAGSSDSVEPSAKGSGLFTTTHWSVVLTAGQSDSPQAAQALETLCRTYWYPLYAYARRRGHGHKDAQDLTQAFLLQLLERRSFARVVREAIAQTVADPAEVADEMRHLCDVMAG